MTVEERSAGEESEEAGLSGEEVAGVCVGVVMLLVVMLVMLALAWRRWNR
jgi:tetrahydromethanopterin S-methyltransferase subunit F